MTAATRDGDSEDEFTTMGPDARDYGRYAEVHLEDERVLLYDQDDETAWIQSDVSVPLAEAA